MRVWLQPRGGAATTVEPAVESEAVALDQLLGLDAGVEVSEPPSLRAALAALNA